MKAIWHNSSVQRNIFLKHISDMTYTVKIYYIIFQHKEKIYTLKIYNIVFSTKKFFFETYTTYRLYFKDI